MKESNYRIHLLYWAIIFILLSVFLILCVPGRINEEAFSNFSFASVLVSIVLAVISIVLSLSVGQATTHYNLEIKDIEKEVSEKLKKFDDLDSSIRLAVESIVKKEVDGVKERQIVMNNKIEDLIRSKNSYDLGAANHDGSLNLSSTSYLCVASLYIAYLCYKTKKPFPFSQLKQHSWIIIGFLNALSTIEPDNLLLMVKDNDVTISKFSNSRWGGEIELKDAIERMDKSDIKNVVIGASRIILEDCKDSMN